MFCVEKTLSEFLEGNYYPYNEDEETIVEDYVAENGKEVALKLLESINLFLDDKRFTVQQKNQFLSDSTCNICGIDHAIQWLLEEVKNPLEKQIALL